jgi:hypothetical protein
LVGCEAFLVEAVVMAYNEKENPQMALKTQDMYMKSNYRF